MNSSYVRRLRLARELLELRKESGLTHEELAEKIGQSRAQISRLENGHVVDLDDVIKILEVFGVVDDRWIEIMTIARDASERGWWESNKAMGPRQALSANLEAGAVSIREYQMVFIPGLLQTPEFARARVDAEQALGPVPIRLTRRADARLGRQRMLRRPDGPTYHVVLDELAIRRATATPRGPQGAAPPHGGNRERQPEDHRAGASGQRGHRCLRIAALGLLDLHVRRPRSDPRVVTVDTVTDDLVLTEVET